MSTTIRTNINSSFHTIPWDSFDETNMDHWDLPNETNIVHWDLPNETNIDHWDLPNLTNGGPVNEFVCMVLNVSAIQFHDESKDLMGEHVGNVFNNIVHIIVYPVLFFVGFPSNLMNLLVFFKHGLQQRINLCLFSLALMDIVFVTLTFVLYGSYVENVIHKGFTASMRNVGQMMEIFINSRLLGLYAGAGYSSQFISAVIAGERCLCVVWPLRSSAILKTKTMGVVLLVGVLLIFGGRFVVAMKFQMVCVEDAVSGSTSLVLSSSHFYRTHKTLVDILDGIVFGLGLNGFLCIFSIITTTITAISLRRSTQFQRDFSSSATTLSARNVAVTRMLIYLSIQYIAFNTPNILFRLSVVFLPELSINGNWANLFLMLLPIPEMFGVCSSSLNFLIYYFFGSKYRESVLEILGKCRKVK